MSGSSQKPAAELARANTAHFPNESAEYRRAREQLLVEEIELRRHAERVAEVTRKRGPLVVETYALDVLEGPKGEVLDHSPPPELE